MGHRFQARRGNGRFTRNTMENTFGLSVQTCPWPDCRRFNPRPVGEAPRETCHACGRSLDPKSVASSLVIPHTDR
jgi:hypothetical protein